MGFIKILFTWAALLCFVHTQFLFADDTRVAFKSDNFEFETSINQNFEVDLMTLLSEGGENLEWTTGAAKPDWITVDSDNGRMFGTPSPSDIGTASFRLIVKDADAGAITLVTIDVG